MEIDEGCEDVLGKACYQLWRDLFEGLVRPEECLVTAVRDETVCLGQAPKERQLIEELARRIDDLIF